MAVVLARDFAEGGQQMKLEWGIERQAPLPPMREIYARSLAFMEQSVGPDYLPLEYVRESVSIDVPTEMAHPSRL